MVGDFSLCSPILLNKVFPVARLTIGRSSRRAVVNEPWVKSGSNVAHHKVHLRPLLRMKRGRERDVPLALAQLFPAGLHDTRTTFPDFAARPEVRAAL